MSARFMVLVCTLVLLTSATVDARTWLVTPDGTGDAPTIAAAVDSMAEYGDSIALADGVYTGPGNRNISAGYKAFIVESQSGDPTACVVDLEGNPDGRHFGFSFVGDG